MGEIIHIHVAKIISVWKINSDQRVAIARQKRFFVDYYRLGKH
jgi:hypothetical protein